MNKPRQNRSSQLSGFYKKDIVERIQLITEWAALDRDDAEALAKSLSVEQADKLIENVVGRYSLPFGIATNFLVNGCDYLVPMVVEEPSVVAAVSFAAKLARSGGGFYTGSTEPVMIAQIQLLNVPDQTDAAERILAAKETLLAEANTSPTIAKRGGGPVDITVHHLLETPTVPMTIVHLLFDARDAMGANAINTAAETIAPTLEQLSGGRALLRILSNLSDQRRAWAEVLIPASTFDTPTDSGREVAEGIAHANAFAYADPYRAATHNKGILNGIDAVAVATGNDWRAIEAGAHAYAARDGQYRALTEWRIIENRTNWASLKEADERSNSSYRIKIEASAADSALDSIVGSMADAEFPLLYGCLELPLAVGIVGGATLTHPTAQIALKILDINSANELSELMAAVGLAQNLAAIRALSTEGIQSGHMALHARQIAAAAGATGDRVDRVAAQLVQEGEIRMERAQEILCSKLVDDKS
ncbi:hydroxymethylglutaryl-CoA reductase, degradative [Chloroflexi bacterium TSY]|nr:hydroxymethylglutaryl-CoA reductase, degradative [Chloroflexi bacterium TSY]